MRYLCLLIFTKQLNFWLNVRDRHPNRSPAEPLVGNRCSIVLEDQMKFSLFLSLAKLLNQHVLVLSLQLYETTQPEDIRIHICQLSRRLVEMLVTSSNLE